jgi:hypothetical protein
MILNEDQNCCGVMEVRLISWSQWCIVAQRELPVQKKALTVNVLGFIFLEAFASL